MPRLLDHLTDLFKKTDDIYHALRYNSPVRKMLRELDSMDRCARLTLSDYLARRTLDWAAHCLMEFGGWLLHERPLVGEKSNSRFTCFVAA